MSTRSEMLKTGDYDALQINETLLYTVVCHRKEIDPQDALDRACFPAGTSTGWTFLNRESLPDGWWEGEGAFAGRKTPYPQPCNDHPSTHVHSVGAC